jgi:MtN3 and saliva related transmembrane protein
MPLTDFIGYAAATLTTASFIPQAWLTFKTRDVSGISLSMYSAFTLGIALWLAYGLLIEAWPVVIANVITLALASSILWMRLRFGAATSSTEV